MREHPSIVQSMGAEDHRAITDAAWNGDARAVKLMADLGFDPSLNRVFGIVLLVCLIAYVVPATSILGAVLLTGYLGGAVATNLLTEQPIVSTTLFPIYTGIFVWGGLWLRDLGVRRIMPIRRG